MTSPQQRILYIYTLAQYSTAISIVSHLLILQIFHRLAGGRCRILKGGTAGLGDAVLWLAAVFLLPPVVLIIRPRLPPVVFPLPRFCLGLGLIINHVFSVVLLRTTLSRQQ